jgi:hypothetical protein
VEEIKGFMEERGLQHQAGILKGSRFEEPMKNKCYFDLAEKIRFAKMQRESLRDTGAYNRHIAKSLSEMKQTLVIIFELGIQPEEILPILQQYQEYTGSVQTEQAWADYDALKVYPVFQQFERDHPAERYRSD